jgi:hypothetical protein
MSLSFAAHSKFSVLIASFISSLIFFSTGAVFHLKKLVMSLGYSGVQRSFLQHHHLHNQK